MALSAKPPKPPNSSSAITTLSSLTPRTNAPLIAILLGIDGPRQVTLRATSRQTLVANLLLCDDTHEGRKLSLWGHAALRATNLRILDILHLTRITLHGSSDELRLPPGGTLTTLVPAHATSAARAPDARVAALLRFRGTRFRELCGLAARGRLLAREWGVARAPARAPSSAGAIREFEDARVACARIRVPRRAHGGKVAAVRAVCRRVCQRCQRRLQRERNGKESAAVRCACGGATQWRFGWLLLGIRGIDVRACGGAGGAGRMEDPVFVVVEGEALGRLLFGVDVRRIVADSGVAMACYDMLETLVHDGGVFRVVLRVGTGRPRLLDLHV